MQRATAPGFLASVELSRTQGHTREPRKSLFTYKASGWKPQGCRLFLDVRRGPGPCPRPKTRAEGFQPGGTLRGPGAIAKTSAFGGLEASNSDFQTFRESTLECGKSLITAETQFVHPGTGIFFLSLCKHLDGHVCVMLSDLLT